MGSITKEMIEASYEWSKMFDEGKVSRGTAIDNIVRETDMNPTSASNMVLIYVAMRNGEVYKRAMSNASTEYYLKKMGEDFGTEAQKKAAKAVLLHVDYYESLSNGGRQVRTREIAQYYLRKI